MIRNLVDHLNAGNVIDSDPIFSLQKARLDIAMRMISNELWRKDESTFKFQYSERRPPDEDDQDKDNDEGGVGGGWGDVV